jgi:4-amino-4-deoxy-L-arabinose transferase-like glycosyltransferase
MFSLLKKNLKVHNLILGLLLAIFLVFTIYLALNLKMGISPDSWYHLRVSQKFSETFGIPENGQDTYKWRDIEHIPYLYFWINARLLNLNSITFNFNEVILLRVINVIYSFFTLVGTYLLSKEFFKKKWLRILPVFLLSNTLMFLFLSSSINYDNLGNMFAVFSILYFVRAVKKKGDWKSIFLMVTMIGLGGLTKYTTLPLSFILVLLTTVWVIKNWRIYKRELKGKVLYWLIPLIILVALNIGVYGVNLVKFQSLQPKCLDVLTYDQCLQNGVFVRDNEWIPPVEVNLIDMISSGGRLDPIRYSGIWIWEMTKRVVGIMGDKSLFALDIYIPFYLFFVVVTLLLAILNWKKFNIETKFISIVTLFYLLVLLLVQNYDMYLKRGYPTLALQGRYMFPVISSFYILLVLFLNRINSKWLRGLLFAGLIVLFILGCLPFFFQNVDWSWFGSIEY